MLKLTRYRTRVVPLFLASEKDNFFVEQNNKLSKAENWNLNEGQVSVQSFLAGIIINSYALSEN